MFNVQTIIARGRDLRARIAKAFRTEYGGVRGVPGTAACAFAVLALALGAYALSGAEHRSSKTRRSLAAAVARAEQLAALPNPACDGTPSAVSPVDRRREKDEESRARARIAEAEALFQRAVKSFEHGNAVQAQELYERSIAALAGARLSADAWYRTNQDLSLLFHRLRDASSSACPVRKDADGRPIPLDRENELVRRYLKIYTAGTPREKVLQALERSGRYRAMIRSVLEEYGLPEELVYLPVLESLYDENDLSSAGALGLWQLMPGRARDLGLRVNFWIDERKDPERSTRAAARYLKQLFTLFDDWPLALAAYNRGENGLVRDLAFAGASNITELRERGAVPTETRNYFPQFIVCVLIGNDPDKFGFRPVYQQPAACDEVKINAEIDLGVAARCAGTTPEVLRALNPALTAWCTPPNYPDFILRLPAGTKERFAAAIAREPDLNPSRGYVRYRVNRGDTLASIAKYFRTTPSAIRDDNRALRSRRCKPNQVLLIRPGKGYF